MENYQDYYADLDLEYPDQQQHWTVQNPSKAFRMPFKSRS